MDSPARSCKKPFKGTKKRAPENPRNNVPYSKTLLSGFAQKRINTILPEVFTHIHPQ